MSHCPIWCELEHGYPNLDIYIYIYICVFSNTRETVRVFRVLLLLLLLLLFPSDAAAVALLKLSRMHTFSVLVSWFDPVDCLAAGGGAIAACAMLAFTQFLKRLAILPQFHLPMQSSQ